MSEQSVEDTRIQATGVTGSRFAMPLELGKVREFSIATAAPTAPFLTDASPVIPPTFLTTSRLWEDDNPWPKVGLIPARVLHAEQEYVFHGSPPRVGIELTGESKIENVFVKNGRRGTMTFAVMVTRFFDAHGQLRAEARMTGVETAPITTDSAPGEDVPAAQEPAGAGVQDAGPGSTLRTPNAPEPAVHGPLTITDFVRYQGASGDMNPLHHNVDVARRAGFASPISVGMLQAGLLASYAVSWGGADSLRRIRIRFSAPVLVGDSITCQLAEEPTRDGELADIHVICTRQNGTVAAEAWAQFQAEG